MDIDMKLKIGDKVRMTPRGFKFYSNIDIAFDMGSFAGVMNEEQFNSAVCELFSIHGIGTVKGFNSCGEPFVKFKYSLDGIKYHYSSYFELKDVRKLNILEKIILKLKGSL
jgi:hypothetical protein